MHNFADNLHLLVDSIAAKSSTIVLPNPEFVPVINTVLFIVVLNLIVNTFLFPGAKYGGNSDNCLNKLRIDVYKFKRTASIEMGVIIISNIILHKI